MSLYAEYMKERSGIGCLETEEGFATFTYPNENIVYVIDVYVKPELRRQGIASLLVDRICDLAKETGRKQLLLTVDLNTKGSQESLKVCMAYGAKLSHGDKEKMFLYKDLGEVDG